MIQHKVLAAPLAEAAETMRPSLWGLCASDLHDAYWRTFGVQCIRQCQSVSLQRGADLFMLLDSRQLVLFELTALAEHLAWRSATVTRIRITDTEEETYKEQVDLDERGFVRCIARTYQPAALASHRILLTRRRDIARKWMAAGGWREAWVDIRTRVGFSGIDRLRYPGQCCQLGCSESEGRMLTRLVGLWRCPGRAIDGVDEVREGVWCRRGQSIGAGVVAIGPVWLGESTGTNGRALVGPLWKADEIVRPTNGDVRLRDIAEIEPHETSAGASGAASGRVCYAVAKRAMDVIGSGLGLAMLSPVLIVIALCILIGDGSPVFYGHRRQGRGGRVFNCWKFRTMRRDADLAKHDLAKRNVCDGPQFYVRNDPRTTRCGRILRRYHLDEIPQLWNVLAGTMSLVGPRPSPDAENRICPGWREIRLSVRPGITGLWQIRRTRKRGVDFQEWIRYDTEYVDRAGFWLDVRILIETVWMVLKRLMK